MTVLVSLPAYNEERYIAAIVSETRKYADEVIVLNDGSTDNTAREADLAGATVLSHRRNRGYGATIQSILALARSRECDVLVIIDADNQHDPREIPLLTKPILGWYDLAIGRRRASDIPWTRRIGGRVLSVFTWILSGKKVVDSQCGFRAYSKKAVELIRPKENGMAVSSEIVAETTRYGLKIIEVPISVRYTADSSTHNPWKQGFYTLWRVVVMMVERRWRT
tara:strand:+ start:8698 stop:9366 length:669 start_codon:yes stop_codon:yes gene_type:complete